MPNQSCTELLQYNHNLIYALRYENNLALQVEYMHLSLSPPQPGRAPRAPLHVHVHVQILPDEVAWKRGDSEATSTEQTVNNMKENKEMKGLNSGKSGFFDRGLKTPKMNSATHKTDPHDPGKP